MSTRSARAPSSHLLAIEDLTDEAIDRILSRAAAAKMATQRGKVVALLFLQSSLRTKAGYAIAAARLGASAIVAEDPRWTPDMSDAESFEDTLRTLSGMADVTVVRVPTSIASEVVRAASVTPVVNGGGIAGEHPTQAIIDLHAMTTLLGDVADLDVIVMGDLTMRASRSLLALLGRRPPSRLRLIAPTDRSVDVSALPSTLRGRTSLGESGDLHGADVLYLPGLPPRGTGRTLDATARSAFALTERSIASLPADAVVLSPMPVIDEIVPAVRTDPRIRIHQQSDLGVSVRMSVLTEVLDAG